MTGDAAREGEAAGWRAAATAAGVVVVGASRGATRVAVRAAAQVLDALFLDLDEVLFGLEDFVHLVLLFAQLFFHLD